MTSLTRSMPQTAYRQPETQTTSHNRTALTVTIYMKSLLMKRSVLTLLALLLVYAPLSMNAQTSSGSLSGVVADKTGARIPDAKIVLRNTKSGDERKTVSSPSGVFNFNFIPASTYTITVTRDGFATLVTKNIEVHPNDQLNLAELKMDVGAESTTVTVEAETDISTSGERSSVITSRDIAKLSTVGRDVSELLKTQAGFSQTQAGLDNSGTSAEVAGAYSGLGAYVGNGATGNGASLISDGSNVTDPGNGAGQTQIVNMDMVQEVKIETSNFGADTAKGPTVITAVGKSGGQNFHGNVQLYARDHVLNAEDWFAKFQGLPQIPDRYLYPGAGIGGPVLIPGTNFNHNRKLTFQANAEAYLQTNTYAYGSPLESFLQALVPTQAMRNGDFSASSIASYLGTDPTTLTTQCTATGTLSQYLHSCGIPVTTNAGFLSATGTTRNFTGGTLNGGIEPNAAAILNAYYPLPSGPTVNGFNYHTLNLEDPNIYQGRLRLDYAFNDSNKLNVTYNGQFGTTTGIPENIYYSPGTSNSAVIGGVDTPGKTNSVSRSNLGSINYTRVISEHATNEMFAGLSTSDQFYNGGNTNLLQKSTYGYSNTAAFFPNASKELPSYATYSTSGSQVLPFSLVPDFSNGQYVAKKFLPSAGDNFSYLYKSHSFKIGFYAERDTANQTDLSPNTNGTIADYYVGNVTSSAPVTTTVGCPPPPPGTPPNPPPTCQVAGPENYLADLFLGAMGSFTQQNKNQPSDLYYWTLSGYVTDSWKVTKRLTLDYGVRLDHLGPWNDQHGLGLPIFSDALYNSDPHSVTGVGGTNPDGTPFFPGVRWRGGNGSVNPNAGYRSIPNSGAPGRWAFVSPRFGFAFDAKGNGTTIIRGGWGMFRAHDSWNDFVGPAETPQGIFNIASSGIIPSGQTYGPGYITFNQLNQVGNAAPGTNGVTGQSAFQSSVFALDAHDSQQPLTETYSFSVSQRMPKDAVFDIAYVGNTSTNLLTDNASNTAVNSNDLRDINAIPLGSFFRPDPNPGSPYYGQIPNPNSQPTQEQDDYRRYPYYAHIGVPRHISYANYNALQASLNRQKGRLNYGLNYTWSKALGVRGNYANGLTGDPTNLRANYGPLGFDRTNILNLSYSFDTQGSIHSSHRWIRESFNGILISGITLLQSGPNLQAVGSPNLFLTGNTQYSYNGASCTTSGGNICTINSATVLGTPDILLQPTLRPANGCPSGNPTSNLATHQYINGYCFGVPQIGVNGPVNLGYLRGPAFTSSDLFAQKTVVLHGSKNLQFRVAAFNFMNHPLVSFSSRYPQEASLILGGTSFADAAITNATNTNGGGCSASGTTCFGYAGYKTGRRVLELEGKFNF